mmetsp:Transcript_9348/g.28124  ORF Transcript_9348/g.28124 Transcript_9348/m.28124 type:complete len:605 (+) Transcript_9348:419-2233(+)
MSSVTSPVAWTTPKAASKCRRAIVLVSNDSIKAARPASRTKAVRSAPVKCIARAASACKSTSAASGVVRVCTARMAARPSTSGGPTSSKRSKRPGRSRAGSTMSGRLVAANTVTPVRSCMPSISCSNVAITRVSRLLPVSPLGGARPSSSSRKMTDGAARLALLNKVTMAFSDSPTYLEKRSGLLMVRKLRPASPATARPSNVFEHPGGPYNSTPPGCFAPYAAKRSGYFCGHSTASLRRSFTPCRPPTSDQRVSGNSTATSLRALGRARARADAKSSAETLRLPCRGTAAGATPENEGVLDSDTAAAVLTVSSMLAEPIANVSDFTVSEPSFVAICCTRAMQRRSAVIAASATSAAKSAATKACAAVAKSCTSSALREWLTEARCDLRISARCEGVGTPISSSVSKRPGRRSAPSIASGRLVAAITTTRSPSVPFRAWRSRVLRLVLSAGLGASVLSAAEAKAWPPSISVSRQDTSLAADASAAGPPAESPPVLAGATESASSKKMTDGAAALAAANTPRNPCSLSPTASDTTSEPFSRNKVAPASAAAAAASTVLPHPGGPCNSTPRGALMPYCAKSSGACSGSVTSFRSSSFCSEMPPRLL